MLNAGLPRRNRTLQRQGATGLFVLATVVIFVHAGDEAGKRRPHKRGKAEQGRVQPRKVSHPILFNNTVIASVCYDRVPITY
jgi:hypothetical protein